MNALSRAGLYVVAATILAAAGEVYAQSPPQSPPQQPATQAGPGVKPDENTQPRRGRQAKKPRRTSRRPPAPVRVPSGRARTSRDGGPGRNELTLTANALGGYDSNMSAAFGTGPAVAASPLSGPTGYLDATLGYSRGNAVRSIRVESTGNYRAYPDSVGRPAAGGGVSVDLRAPLARSLAFRASERFVYEPFYSVFSAGASSTPLPPAIGGPISGTGLFERRSVSSNTSLSLERAWTRHSTSLSYSYRQQRFTDSSNGNNSGHGVQAEYSRSLARGVSARAIYQYFHGEYIESQGTALPTTEHRIEGGPDIEKAVSRRRRITLSLTGGASRIDSATVDRRPYRSWVPVGGANATVAFSAGSSAEVGYRRGFSLLRGITNEVYTTDTAFASASRLLTARTNLRVGATYSNWNTPIASGVDESLRVYGASMQVVAMLGSGVSATVGYSYYYHRYSDPGTLPPGFPAQYDRHAVNVGLTFARSLKGTPAALTPR